MSKNNPEQQEKLVTVAIHTFEKAQILQTLLQSEGIEATLQNVNQQGCECASKRATYPMR